MNGSIDVESIDGSGACFWFSIPLQIARNTPDARANSQLPVDLKGLRVLVVDKSTVSREILGSYLSKLRAVSESVLDGEAALRELTRAAEAKLHYNAVILNPANDSALAKTIKQDTLLSATYLVCLSDYPKNGQAASEPDLLFSASLSKPIKQIQLLQALGNLSRQPVNRNVPAPTPTTTAIAIKDAQVLLVEDNAINQKVAAMQLRKLGLSVQTAANGQEALDSWAEGSYSLILMDCQMPILDGFEATRQIRQRESGSRQRIPIVAMTANAMQGDKEQCLAAGMDDYISKPINLSQLQAVLEKWLLS
jgi:CheY-like chemotaxis protein